MSRDVQSRAANYIILWTRSQPDMGHPFIRLWIWFMSIIITLNTIYKRDRDSNIVVRLIHLDLQGEHSSSRNSATPAIRARSVDVHAAFSDLTFEIWSGGPVFSMKEREDMIHRSVGASPWPHSLSLSSYLVCLGRAMALRERLVASSLPCIDPCKSK